jgi:hypothetical protein
LLMRDAAQLDSVKHPDQAQPALRLDRLDQRDQVSPFLTSAGSTIRNPIEQGSSSKANKVANINAP